MATVAEKTLDSNENVAVRVTTNSLKNLNEHTVDANGNPALRIVCEDGSMEGGASSSAVASVNGIKGTVTLTGEEIMATLSNPDTPTIKDTQSITEHLQTIKNEQADFSNEIGTLRDNAIRKDRPETQNMIGGLGVGGEFSLLDNDDPAQLLTVLTLAVINGVPTLVSNNGIDIISLLNLDVAPRCNDKTAWSDLNPTSLITKQHALNLLGASDITFPVTPSAANNYTTVKKYGNGYVEISGIGRPTGNVGPKISDTFTVSFPDGYVLQDANYVPQLTPTSGTEFFDIVAEAKKPTTTGFTIAVKNTDDSHTASDIKVGWMVCGFLAQ